MENKRYSLGNRETGKLINIIRILFGIVCIAVAFFWLLFNLRSVDSTGSIWMTVFFLLSFGFYQIWAGTGRAERYIIFCENSIILKRYIFLPPFEIKAVETKYVELYPLKVVFNMISGKKILLRFGTTYYESNERIFEEINAFAERHNIEHRFISEEL